MQDDLFQLGLGLESGHLHTMTISMCFISGTDSHKLNVMLASVGLHLLALAATWLCCGALRV